MQSQSHIRYAQDQPPESLSVLSGWATFANAASAPYLRFLDQACQLLGQREQTIAALRTVEDWQTRQAQVRQALARLVGPFPERTPLNARVIGTLAKPRYHLEKVIFESRPEFYVTGCLFVPEGLQGRAPAILNPIGHTDIAFRGTYYQNFILNLVQKGFIVLTIDPIGQGERVQYYDLALGRSLVGSSCPEHDYAGNQCFLTGSCLARYCTWDGIRAIDYLLSRDEVDPGRIGVTGLSGGGTLTAYISAFDERVLAAVPACYITSFRRLLQSIGPQDAEQIIPAGIANHIDMADLLEVRAPKPLLISATSRDFFNIQGARETYEEVGRAYRAFGQEGNLLMTEDDAEHGFTPRNNEATYAFFQRFLDLPGDPSELPVELLTAEELRITPSGQVATSLGRTRPLSGRTRLLSGRTRLLSGRTRLLSGGQTVWSLNRVEAEQRLSALAHSRRDLAPHLAKVLDSAAALSGYAAPAVWPEAIFCGRSQRQGYAIEKCILRGEGDCVTPALLLLPGQVGPHPAVIYLSPEGKAAEAQPGGLLEWFVRQGYAVLAPDLAGCGELKGGDLGYEQAPAYAALLVGRSLVGWQAGNIVRLVRYLLSRDDIAGDGLAAVAQGAACPALLHAAAFEPAIARIALIQPLLTYASAVLNRFYDATGIAAFASGVPSALTAYDLPDLAATLAPRPLLMASPLDQNGNPAPESSIGPEPSIGPQPSIGRDLEVVRRAYAAAGAGDNLTVRAWQAWQGPATLFAGWLG